MKGNGNGIGTLVRKLWFAILPTALMRSNYIQRHRKMFKHIGSPIQWQPRKFPSDPELISIGDNVRLASGVSLINHDAVSTLLNDSGLWEHRFRPMSKPIEIGNNVLIGSQVLIMPNVKIGNNVVIAAGSIVTKDIPDNSVAAGVPAKVIDSFDHLVERRKNMKVSIEDGVDKVWEEFYNSREGRSGK